MSLFNPSVKKKANTAKSVCEAMVSAGLIKSFEFKKVDASWAEDGSLMFTSVKIVPVAESPIVEAVSTEAYGKKVEFYIHSKSPRSLVAALKVAGVDVSKAKSQIIGASGRVVLPVSFFKAFHWWE